MFEMVLQDRGRAVWMKSGIVPEKSKQKVARIWLRKVVNKRKTPPPGIVVTTFVKYEPPPEPKPEPKKAEIVQAKAADFEWFDDNETRRRIFRVDGREWEVMPAGTLPQIGDFVFMALPTPQVCRITGDDNAVAYKSDCAPWAPEKRRFHMEDPSEGNRVLRPKAAQGTYRIFRSTLDGTAYGPNKEAFFILTPSGNWFHKNGNHGEFRENSDLVVAWGGWPKAFLPDGDLYERWAYREVLPPDYETANRAISQLKKDIPNH